jgi:hypothetical protein
MPRIVSNKKIVRVQLKVDVWPETRDKLRTMAADTGQSMAMITNLIVKYFLTEIVLEEAVRRSLAEYARKNKDTLKLSKKQKRIIENADPARHDFTKDLL